MFKRRFSLAACGALVLLLTAAESSHAQFFRGGLFWPGLSYPAGPNYYNDPRSSSYYKPPPTSQTGFQQYGVTTTPIYYGAATSMFYGDYSSSSPGGTALRGPGNVSAAAHETPSYPIQPPNYTIRNPVSPPLDNTAQLVVRLPADAELWFEGQKTSQTGTDRTFHSPDLEPGPDYVYTVRAHWTADGKPVEETRNVTVHAGDRVVVRFPKP